MSETTRWSCSLCQSPIKWVELFTFYSKGPVHWDCLKSDALSKLQGKIAGEALSSLLELLDSELKLIVGYKKAMSTAIDDEAKSLYEGNEKDAEKHSALLTKYLDKLMSKAG